MERPGRVVEVVEASRPVEVELDTSLAASKPDAPTAVDPLVDGAGVPARAGVAPPIPTSGVPDARSCGQVSVHERSSMGVGSAGRAEAGMKG